MLHADLEPFRVLVVHPSDHFRHHYSSTLQSIDCVVQTAKDGFEGLSQMSDFQPNLILAGYHMPRVNGLRFFDIVRRNKDFAEVPRVLLLQEQDIFERAWGRISGSTEQRPENMSDEQIFDLMTHFYTN